jgi:hypothetical protein
MPPSAEKPTHPEKHVGYLKIIFQGSILPIQIFV